MWALPEKTRQTGINWEPAYQIKPNKTKKTEKIEFNQDVGYFAYFRHPNTRRKEAEPSKE